MSLENQIQNLTDAINALNEVIVSAVRLNMGCVDDVQPKVKTESPAVTEEKPKRTRAKKEEAAPEPTKKLESIFDDELEEASLEDDGLGLDDDEPEVTEAELKSKFTKLAQVKGRETVLSLIKKYSDGGTNFQSLKPANYAKAYKELTELLGG